MKYKLLKTVSVYVNEEIVHFNLRLKVIITRKMMMERTVLKWDLISSCRQVNQTFTNRWMNGGWWTPKTL